MSSASYPTWIEINLSAIEHNVKYLCSHTGVDLMAVVKADAYGHGAVEVGKAALSAGATWLAVARFGEARILRQAGITVPILLFGMTTPEEVDEAIQLQITLPLYDFPVAELYSQRAKALGKNIDVHLKVDTGLGRLGVLSADILPLARYALKLGSINLEGLFTHYAMADDPKNELTAKQLERFKEALQSLEEGGIHPRWIHTSNSAATMAFAPGRFNLVRAGSAVVGLQPFSGMPFPPELRTSLSWKARLASCKEIPAGWGISYGQQYHTTTNETLGILPVGYGDGWRRVTTNEVLIDDQRVPVVGRVCMDQCMLRLPRPYPIGTEIVLIGTQGDQTIDVTEVAARWGTVEVDVTANINHRIPRVSVYD